MLKKTLPVSFCIPYFGQWPFWMRLFLESCRPNSCAEFLLFADHPLPIEPPENVRFIPMTLVEFEKRVSQVLEMPVKINDTHKVCDFRPFFSYVFSDYLCESEFWGYCDIDLVFGDLSRVLNPENLADIDILTAYPRFIAGHFTVLRNCEAVNSLAFQIDDYKSRANALQSTHMDEGGITKVVGENPQIRLKRPESLEQELQKGKNFTESCINFGFKGEITDFPGTGLEVAVWENGKIFFHSTQFKVVEALYIHFMGLKRHSFYWNNYNSHTNYHKFSFSQLGFSDKIFSPKDLTSPLLSLQRFLILSVTRGRILAGYLAQRTLGVSNARRFVLYMKKTLKINI